MAKLDCILAITKVYRHFNFHLSKTKHFDYFGLYFKLSSSSLELEDTEFQIIQLLMRQNSCSIRNLRGFTHQHVLARLPTTFVAQYNFNSICLTFAYIIFNSCFSIIKGILFVVWRDILSLGPNKLKQVSWQNFMSFVKLIRNLLRTKIYNKNCNLIEQEQSCQKIARAFVTLFSIMSLFVHIKNSDHWSLCT